MLANVHVVGNVGSMRVFENENGGKTVYFSVAVNQRAHKGENGDEQRPPIWYSFRAINGLAEMLSQYLTKGRLVAVSGVSPRLRDYETERTIKVEGVGAIKFKDKQTAVDYLVVDLRFIGAAPNGQQKDSAEIVGTVVKASAPELAELPF